MWLVNKKRKNILFPLEEGFGEPWFPIVGIPSGVGFKNIEFLLDEVVFGIESKGADGRDAQFGCQLKDFALETLFAVDGADAMAHQNVPGGDGELAGQGDRGLVSAAAQGEGQAPFAQRILDLQEALGGLDEQSTDGAATMAFEGSLALPISALADAGVEPKVGHQLLWVGKAPDITDRTVHAVDAHQTESGEPGELEKGWVLGDFARHLMAQLLAPSPRAEQCNVHLFEQQALHRAPVLEGVQPLEGDRGRQPEAGWQAQAVFVEHGLDVLLKTCGLFDHALISAEEFPAFAGALVGLPDNRGKSAEVDARNLHGIDAVVSAVALADLAGHFAFQHQDLAANGLQPARHGEGIAASLHDQGVLGTGVPQSPAFQLGELNPRRAMDNLGTGRISSLKDAPGKCVGMDVESDDSTFWIFHA